MSKRYIQPKIRRADFDAEDVLIGTSVTVGTEAKKGDDGTTDLSGAEAKQGFGWNDSSDDE